MPAAKRRLRSAPAEALTVESLLVRGPSATRSAARTLTVLAPFGQQIFGHLGFVELLVLLAFVDVDGMRYGRTGHTQLCVPYGPECLVRRLSWGQLVEIALLILRAVRLARRAYRQLDLGTPAPSAAAPTAAPAAPMAFLGGLLGTVPCGDGLAADLGLVAVGRLSLARGAREVLAG